MKPTQQAIIEMARKAGAPDWWIGVGPGGETDGNATVWLTKFASETLERFGAGGGEPVATLYGTLPVYDTPQPAKQGGQETKIIQLARDTGVTDTREYGESIPIECLERFAALIRAAALEDAKKEVGQFNVDGADAIVEAIEALKGK